MTVRISELTTRYKISSAYQNLPLGIRTFPPHQDLPVTSRVIRHIRTYPSHQDLPVTSGLTPHIRTYPSHQDLPITSSSELSGCIFGFTSITEPVTSGSDSSVLIVSPLCSPGLCLFIFSLLGAAQFIRFLKGLVVGAADIAARILCSCLLSLYS